MAVEKQRRMNAGIDRAFADVARALEDPAAFRDRAIPTRPEQLVAILTPERVRLYRLVKDAGSIESIQHLADALQRDPTRVGRDVALLEGAGLLRIERDGKTKRVLADERVIVLV